MDFNYLNFSWIIEGALAGSVGATERKDLFFFKMQEISSVVRLDENNISAEPWQLFELFEPIDSLANADFEQINRISVFIEEQFEKWERPVVVTCETGNEITGVILACYLVYVGHSAESAIAAVESSRPGTISDNESVVYSYESSIRPSSM
ncbi:MAG: hypothetical protein FI721_06325 [SAR202 cluster bacterium]|jgi:protein-tyrosine phosphatase|nr:hypothetical protein [Dehalococcoidia bacterium]MQG16915.1 hypothetical protein [SAR202 cluster bacterium]CAI8255852.1 MAG: Uncharacterised protein [Chloroflexota bacterium]MQG26024.1 hypothetical protein [SAR202 cluster bacterium]MQG36347.1 hypothetical protein [SAR202 cluster bacterium]|tara:strand:+ start:4904 stop:5356 length:453 start_codon:yes stop_codon:yes gene_type:complete